MILILTEREDVHADRVEEKLRQRGADLIRFDLAQFPSKATVALSYSPEGQVRGVLHAGEAAIELDRLQAVWFRRPQTPVPHPEVTDRLMRDYVEEECRRFMSDVWHSLDCHWVPALPFVLRRAELKGLQLKVAGELGFELPPTLITNSPEEFLEFYRQHNGNIVSKLASKALYSATGTTFNRYTQVVSKRDVGYAALVRYAPVIFQAYVPKRVELRITVVGQQLFAVEIHSQQSNHTRHDWRRYDFFETAYLPHPLPHAVGQLCVELVERLGLCYGAIDMVLTPDGRYVFLEINPNGQYLWVEDATGLPISDAICDLLMAVSPETKSAAPLFASTRGGL